VIEKKTKTKTDVVSYKEKVSICK